MALLALVTGGLALLSFAGLIHRQLAAICLPFAGLSGLVGLAEFLEWHQDRRRESALGSTARLLGLTFTPRVPWAELAPFRHLPLFRLGARVRGAGELTAWGWERHWAGAANSMQGTFDGCQVALLEFYLRGGFGDGGTTPYRARQAVALLPGAGLPEFLLSPEDGFWRGLARELAADLAGPRLRLPPSAFSAEHVLWGRAEADVLRLFGSELAGYFAEAPGWTVESAGGWLLVYREEEVPDPERWPRLLSKSLDIRAALVEAADAARPRSGGSSFAERADPRVAGGAP
jgi:hypothetical protein